MTVEFFDARDERRLEAALAIRLRVFVEEQGVPLDEEIDAHDRDDPGTRHVLVRIEGLPVATGRFYPADDQTSQIGRLAVLQGWRGRGVGAALLDALVAESRRAGLRRARLDAQIQALDFYTRVGFQAQGEEFLDAGIVHRTMTLELENGTANRE